MPLVVVCGSLRAYILLCLRQHVCAYTGGIPFAPYVSGRAGVSVFSRLHLLVTFVVVVIIVLFSFAWGGVARHVTYLHSARGVVVVACACLLFLCVLYFPLVLYDPLRAFILSFFHPSCPCIPFGFSAAIVVLLCLRRHVCTGIPFIPYVCGVRGWVWSLGYTSWFSLSARLSSCFSWRRSVALHGM